MSTLFGIKQTIGVLMLTALFLPAINAGGSSFSQTKRRTTQTETWRKQRPPADPPRPFSLPKVRQSQLDNGLSLLLIEDHTSPIATIVIGVPMSIEPSDVDGMTRQTALAEATAELITEGTGSKTSEQVAREVETLGGRLASSANDDFAEISGSVISENVDRMMDVLGDVLLHPAFPENEVVLYKKNRIQTLVVQRQDPSYLAGEEFSKVVFGLHPYAISSPTPASVDALDRQKISEFYSSRFGPRGAAAVIVGDFDATKMEAKARQVLAPWKDVARSTAARKETEFPKPTETRIYLVNRPASEQSDFRIGNLSITRTSPDYFPLVVANSILGAGTGSRLFLNIREKKGFAYDVYSTVGALKFAGDFFAGAETRTEVTAQAIKEMLGELDRLQKERVGPQELQDAKNYLNGLFSLSLSTQGGLAGRVLQSQMLELGTDYLESYRAKVDAVTAEQVQEAAKKYMLSSRTTIVVVGDASKLSKDLRPIGPVEIIEIGNSSKASPSS